MSDAGPHIGLIGRGRWGVNIQRDLIALGCRVSVAEHAPAHRAAALAAGASEAVVEASDFAAQPDGFVVATQTASHARVVEALLATGRPIFVEKPMTSDVESAARIAAAAPERVFVMEKWRYHPGVEALATIARSGELGAVECVSARRLQWGVNHTDVDALWIMLPHDLSIVDEILDGLPAPLWANAEWHDGRPVGLTAAFDKARVEVSARRPSFDRTLDVAFEGGVARLADPYDDHIMVYHNDQITTTHEPRGEARVIATEFPLLRELRAFVGYLAGGPPPRCDADRGARTVACIAALRGLAGLC